MLVVVVFLVFLVGLITGGTILWCVLPGRLKHHVDYRQRWEEAITLLGEQGQLTDEQIALIRSETRQPEPQPAAPEAPVRSQHRYASTAQPSAAATLKTLHSMASWDRKDTEIARAKRGLPPLDDLAGMASWDVRDVMKARARWENSGGF